jgi:hypothetical protein
MSGAKPARDTRVRLHSISPSSQPTGKLFTHFVGPLTHKKRGNLAMLVRMDAFCKFVFFRPVQKISSQVAPDSLERAFYPAYATPVSIMTDNARVFCCKQSRDLCFPPIIHWPHWRSG